MERNLCVEISPSISFLVIVYQSHIDNDGHLINVRTVVQWTQMLCTGAAGERSETIIGATWERSETVLRTKEDE
jgi:hypothetical protein